MPQPRAFKDRPLRRIGLAALIAVAVHAVLIGAGAYLFGDYVFADATRPRLTQQRLETAIAESPIILPAGILAGEAGTSAEPESVTADWSNTRLSLPTWSWWSWEADPTLAARPVVPEKRK